MRTTYTNRYNGAGDKPKDENAKADATKVAVAAAASATPWGAIAQGAASVVNNLVSNIFGAKKAKKELELKEQEQKYRQALSTLDNQQKYVLQQKLDNAKTQSERLRILEDSVSQIQIAKINASTKNTNQTAYLVLGSAAILVALLLVIKKTDN